MPAPTKILFKASAPPSSSLFNQEPYRESMLTRHDTTLRLQHEFFITQIQAMYRFKPAKSSPIARNETTFDEISQRSGLSFLYRTSDESCAMPFITARITLCLKRNKKLHTRLRRCISPPILLLCVNGYEWFPRRLLSKCMYVHNLSSFSESNDYKRIRKTDILL